MFRVGIDVGGTFTDFVVVKDEETPRFFKTPSTPADPSEGLLIGLGDVAKDYGISLADLLSRSDRVIHGTTVATNTLVERKGAKVGLITTSGFRDLLEMREGLKEDRYNLRTKPFEPLVPRYLRTVVTERVKWDGSVDTELDEADLEKALDYLQEQGVESLAVCFLFSFMNSDHERRVADRIRERFPDMYASMSHQVVPQIKEFDRLSTTVINSYVGPVFAGYLGRLRERLSSLGRAEDVLIMQSNGGVASIEESSRMAAGAILSGPAGGVSGAAYYGELVGASNIIGLDMGGTSTDISIVQHGIPRLTTERSEAGWQIAVPMIDIETLGAGGGSIARVDSGGILQIGPESAGAVPGPAAYGKGGFDPTVTDANLVLGFLDPSNFLGGREMLCEDLAAAAIAEKVAEPLKLSKEEGAAGVHRLVSTNIAEGVRLMSVKRGVDPRDFALVAYGGAAGLQVSEVARQLGITRAYLPSAGAVLSAYGMLATDLRYDLSLSHPASLEGMDVAAVRAILDDLYQQGKTRLVKQGITDDRVEVTYAADMRYLDQIYEVNVTLPDLSFDDDRLLEDWAQNFHSRYQELYSYSQSEQEIRLVTLRVTVIGRLPKVTLREQTGSGNSQVSPNLHRRVYMGQWHEVPVYDLQGIPIGAEIVGPAILESEYTSIVVGDGDIASADRFGGVQLQIALQSGEDEDSGGHGSEDAINPITLSVLEHRLGSIAEEMMEVMLRTAMSQILNSSRDFSTAILDDKCQLVAQGEGLPVHISALPIAGAAVRDFFGDDIHDGDMFLVNDPYFGGSHLPDITVIKPIFFQGQLLFYTVNRAHHSDVGGGTHGGYNPDAFEIYQEGLRIPPLRIHDKGVPRRDLLHMMSANVRLPVNFLGDMNAQIGSVEIAARRLNELLNSYGHETFSRYVGEIMNSTERQVRGIISGWPDGVYEGLSIIDDDGFDSKNILIRVKITIQGEEMIMDFSESSPQVKGFINSAYANTRSMAHAALMYMLPENIAKNEGSNRPVTIIAPKGSIVNANPPAPVCMSTNHCAEEIIEAIFHAMSDPIPDAVNAAFSRRLRYAITGIDSRTSDRFIWHFFMARGGAGACQGFDGWSNIGENQAAGGIRSPSVEITEERFPLFVRRHEMRPGSGGDGQWRGGLGAVCEIEYEGEGPAMLNTAGDGIFNAPFGLHGGTSGLPHRYSIISNGKERVLKSKETSVVVNPGDRIICLSSGGGGFGDPDKRPQEARDWDEKNGYVE